MSCLHVVKCDGCHEDSCEDCTTGCRNGECGATICYDCAASCESCGENYCVEDCIDKHETEEHPEAGDDEDDDEEEIEE